MGTSRPVTLVAWVRGPRLTLALGGLVLVIVCACLTVAGWTESGLRLAVRVTARTSLVLFLAVFLASALQARWPGSVTTWLRRNRRYVGLAFAISHGLHLLAILALRRDFPETFAHVPWVTVVLGGFGFVVVAVLAATSSDAAVRWLGERRWAGVHRFGVYYLWTIFAVTYARTSLPLAAALVLALVLRLRRR